jgi:hypothetical protein
MGQQAAGRGRIGQIIVVLMALSNTGHFVSSAISLYTRAAAVVAGTLPYCVTYCRSEYAFG